MPDPKPEPIVLTDFFISAVKIGVPGTKDDVTKVISDVNSLIRVLPVDLAPLEYEEFVDRDLLTETDVEVGDEHEAFMHDVFAEMIGDLWTFVTVLHRNGVNQAVRDLHSYLDALVLGTDCVDIMDSLDL